MLVLALVFAAQAQAQTYPARPITMIVPFAPGGIADITGRPLAAAMSRILGQNIVVDNKPGAGGAVGHALTAKAKPDGYTVMMALSSITVIPEADKVNGRPASYQMTDFTPIALISADPTVLLVSADSPWKSLKDLVDDARARPGVISYSTSGLYGTTHTCLEMFAQAAGIRMLHVPYSGGGPSMTALLANQVNVTAQAPGVANPHVKAGKVRALASWGAQRLPSIADIPTMRESGYEAEFYIWSALFAPAGIPAEVRERLTAAARQAAQEQDFQKAMTGMNTPINFKEGREFEAFLQSDGSRLAEVVRKMGKTQ
ncbi:MAG: tripartite tricarboxylate transporter substrate binding protein [Candidatus Parcubacteria bacterium]|nr:tripartite tricarboxylate transporter substrate binding protein [Burkholderiales bacterium]